MKKIGLLAGLLAASTYYAQIKFEKGYFVDNSGTKKEVLIKNVDWKNNPVDFEYKTDESSEIKKESINNVQEFSIDGDQKYVRATVMLDRSSTNLNAMSDKRDPDFKKETLFLKYIIEGKADLLYYEDGNNRSFFYTSEQSEPEQLIYKSYYINESTIGYNEDFKKQIAQHLNCNIKGEQIQSTHYNKKDLTKIFAQYNECSGGSITDYGKQNAKKGLFHLNVRPGVNFSSLSLNAIHTNDAKIDFGNYTSFRIGLEFEYVLPFNKNKWALFTEPTYQYYKGNVEAIENEGSYFENKYNITADYKSIELPIGVRHYFFLNDRSKIFINAAYLLDFSMNSSIEFKHSNLEISAVSNFIFGAGYKYNDKFSAEVRVGTSRNLLRNYVYLSSDYTSVSFILGYTLF
ncbi:PorT family protein [Chryseobacterium sp. PMSZPI]|uniref:PorT family protein n=1 Tax=Chryseobacterium sp. PMSZPI TaxID=1033900 RepID=UPI000C34B317|nr:PorT family protein [Chryseobacterium sp. PMSZPI]PKF74916.1 tRNA modification GTPase [Chryseobacterium sp. PMSZPI]